MKGGSRTRDKSFDRRRSAGKEIKMEIKNGMHFIGNENGREIIIINATPAVVTYRDLEHKTIFTVGRATFERCNIRPAEEEAPTTSPAAEWSAISDEAKFAALKAACSAACALKPANVRAAGGCKPVELVGDAWIRLETRLQSGDPRPLRDQLLFAAMDALRHEARENTHSIGGSAADPADGAADIGPAEKAHNARMRGAAARPIEDAGEIRDAINAAAGDDIDAAIIRGAAAGYTSDDIGAVIGMSGQAVRKRLSAMRARIAAYRDGAGAVMHTYR